MTLYVFEWRKSECSPGNLKQWLFLRRHKLQSSDLVLTDPSPLGVYEMSRSGSERQSTSDNDVWNVTYIFFVSRTVDIDAAVVTNPTYRELHKAIRYVHFSLRQVDAGKSVIIML